MAPVFEFPLIPVGNPWNDQTTEPTAFLTKNGNLTVCPTLKMSPLGY